MLKRYVKYNASQNEECRVSCSQCHGETRHKVLSSVDISADDDEYGIYYWEQNQIIQCQGCETISFRRGSSNSEDLVWDDETKNSVPEVREEIYPSRVAGRHKLNKTYFLPLKVASIYEETHSALCNKLPVLAGIGIRALIETVCKEKNASGDNLQKKIDNLIDIGVLTSDGATILHNLRILGNKAAHEVTPHSEETLGIAFDVVEHLLNGVYILPKVANALSDK